MLLDRTLWSNSISYARREWLNLLFRMRHRRSLADDVIGGRLSHDTSKITT